MKHRIRVGVLRGGPSAEHQISVQSGAEVLSALREHLSDKYQVHDIFIDRQGKWHFDGLPVEIGDLPNRIDFAFNALHGAYGEDGTVQHLFETHGVPFSGSGSLASSLGMNKVLAKKIFFDHGIKSPFGKEIASKDINSHVDSISNHLFQSFLLPAVVKPASSGSSVGVFIVKDYRDLPNALLEAAKHCDTVIIEEMIDGIEATCGVVESFRAQELYALPPIEIRPLKSFFDYKAKYEGQSQEIVPATFSDKIKREIEELSRKIHRALGLKHYSRMDFIIHPRRGVYVLEANTLPGLTKESLLPKSLAAIGSNIPEFIDHVIMLEMAD